MLLNPFCFRFEEKLFLEAADENNGITDNVHLGGAWNTAKIFPGFTQTKFCGCMTHVYFNDVSTLSLSVFSFKNIFDYSKSFKRKPTWKMRGGLGAREFLFLAM